MTSTRITINEKNFNEILFLIEQNPKVSKITMTGFYYIRPPSEGRQGYLDLSALARCENLETLILRDNRQVEIDLSPLSGLSSLRKLTIKTSMLTPFGSQPAKPIDFSPLLGTSLESLEIVSAKIDKLDLLPLGKIPTLKKLTLSRTTLYSIDLEPLKNSNIRILDLTQNPGLKEYDLEHLCDCEHLRTLLIGPVAKTAHFGKIDITPLMRCRNLKRVTLFGRGGVVYTDNSDDIPIALRSVKNLTVLSASARGQKLYSPPTHPEGVDFRKLKPKKRSKKIDKVEYG